MNAAIGAFGCIGSIDPDREDTWRGRIFVTVDVDWASDAVLAHTAELLARIGVAATFFVTHDTPVLRDIRSHPRFELGIHPNFNDLLTGSEAHAGDARSKIAALLDVVPEARCVRSHSMTQSSRLLETFSAFGLTHDCNHFVPSFTGIVLVPYRHWNGMVRVPYFWEHDVALLYRDGMQREMNIRAAARAAGLRVFDFHPIHVALNTPTMEYYEATRAVHRDWDAVRAARHPGFGIATMLELLATEGRS